MTQALTRVAEVVTQAVIHAARVALLPATVPLRPGRDLARTWADQELARPEYQAARPNVIERAVQWFWNKISVLQIGAGPGPVLGLVIAAVVIGVVVAFVLYRTGALRSSVRRRAERVLPSAHTTAADHRIEAERLAAVQQWELAIAERFRAITRELEERALINPQPGRTAVEVASDGGRALPQHAADLLAAARYFDDVSYGHLSVGRSGYLALQDLDTRLRTARPVSV